MAITWQNVGQASGAREAAALYGGAQRSFDSGFNALNKVLDQSKKTQRRNSEQRTENNTQDLLDRVSAVQSVDGWEQGREGIEEAIAGMGSRYDRAAVRDALNARPGQLRKEQTARDTFSDQQLTREQKPIVDGLRLDALNGNWDKVSEGLAGNELVGEADLAEALYGNYTTNRTEYRAKRQDNRSERTTNQTMRLRDNAESRAQYKQNQVELQDSRTEDEYQLGERRKDLENEEYASRRKMNQQIKDSLASISKDVGIPLTESGAPDVSQATPRQLVDMQVGIQDAGLNDLPTASQLDRRFNQRLIDNGVDVRDLPGSTTPLDAAIAANQKLSPQDQAQIQEAQADLDLSYRKPVSLFGGGGSGSPLDDAAEVLGSAQDEDGFLLGNADDDERQVITNEAADVLANGITVDGTSMPVTKATLKMALGNVSGDWEPDSSIKSIIRSQYKKLGMPAQYKRYRDYQGASKALLEGAAADAGVASGRDILRGTKAAIK